LITKEDSEKGMYANQYLLPPMPSKTGTAPNIIMRPGGSTESVRKRIDLRF